MSASVFRRVGIGVCCGIGLFALSSCFYNAGRKWVKGYALGIDSPESARPFRPALTACVAENDPAQLEGVRRGGDYRLSGWFLDQGRLAAVQRCMRKSGWLAMPKTIYTP